MLIPVLVLAVIGCSPNTTELGYNSTCTPQLISKTMLVDSTNQTHYNGAFQLDFNGIDNVNATQFNGTLSMRQVATTLDSLLDETALTNNTTLTNSTDLKIKPAKSSLIQKVAGNAVDNAKDIAAPREPRKSQFQQKPRPGLTRSASFPSFKDRAISSHRPVNYGFNPIDSEGHTQRVPSEIVAHRPSYASDQAAHTPYGHKKFSQECLDSHNLIRLTNNLPPLVWNPTLASTSFAYSHKLSSNGGALIHSNSGYGENLYGGSGGYGYASCDHAIRSWGSEEGLYVAKGSPAIDSVEFGQYGHWTQLVWKDTRSVGCGYSLVNGVASIVCRYEPAGNVIGQTPN